MKTIYYDNPTLTIDYGQIIDAISLHFKHMSEEIRSKSGVRPKLYFLSLTYKPIGNVGNNKGSRCIKRSLSASEIMRKFEEFYTQTCHRVLGSNFQRNQSRLPRVWYF